MRNADVRLPDVGHGCRSWPHPTRVLSEMGRGWRWAWETGWSRSGSVSGGGAERDIGRHARNPPDRAGEEAAAVKVLLPVSGVRGGGRGVVRVDQASLVQPTTHHMEEPMVFLL